MKGFNCGRLLIHAVFATAVLSGCGSASPSQPEKRDLPESQEPAPEPGPAAPANTDDYLASEGEAVTEFNPAQLAALQATLNTEKMTMTDGGYDITPDVAAATVYGMEFRIPTDRKARWGLIDLKKDGATKAMIATHRIGPAGTTYAIRHYDCAKHLVRYVATGETIAEMRRSTADETMSEIVDRSMAYYLGRLACT